MSAKPGRVYEPLDLDGGIRILLLEPGSPDSQICCHLILANLNLKPEYKALSYEWGPADNLKTIAINGQEVSVRQNLWSALKHLRGNRSTGSALCDVWEDGCERLWVDALCINQDDTVERGKQVSIMGSIYRNAKVICWLGDGVANKKHREVMKHLQIKSWDVYGSSKRKLYDSNGGRDISFPQAGKTSITYEPHIRWQAKPEFGVSSNLSYTNVESLCSLSYWRRTWIIQEVVLGKSISLRLGDISVDGDTFFYVCRGILLQNLTMESLLKIDGFRILYLRKSWLSRPQDLTLMKAMEFSEMSSCADLRDRVYGMIGLAHDCKDGQIVADYTKSLMDVYSDVMLHVLYQSRRKIWGRDRKWSDVHHSQLVQRAFFGLSTSLSEQRGTLSKARLEEFAKRGEISIDGILYGTVVDTRQSEPGDMWWAHPGFVKPISFEILAHQSMDTEEYVPIKKVVVDRRHLLQPGAGISKKRLQDLMMEKNGEEEEEEGEEEEEEEEEGKVMHTLSQGNICYAPSNTKVGDVICRFIDSDIAAIVRTGANKSLLVGRAMILGGDQDVSIFAQGVKELRQLKDLDRGRTISLIVTPDELRELTSPCY